MTRMMLLLPLLLLISSPLQAATAWVNQPRGVAIALDAADNVYTVDWDNNPAGDITLTRRDASGVVLWQASFDNTDTTTHEVATWVATDSADNAIVSGTIRSGFSSPVNAASLVMKFSPAGQLLWRRVYESSFDGSSTRRVLVDAADNIYVLGLGTGPAGQVTTVKKFAPDGTRLWSWFDTAGIGAPMHFKLTPDQHIVIAGRGTVGNVNGYAKIGLNGSTVWSLAGVASLTAGDVAGDGAGNSYVVHGNSALGGSDVRKLSPSGATLWSRNTVIAAFRVEAGADGAPVASGFPNAGGAGAAFVKYDANGNRLWQNLDADGPNYMLLLHGFMTLDAAGNAYLAASTLFEMAVCRVNADGTSAWVQTAPSGSSSALALGSDDSVYVVGGNTAKFTQTITPPPAQSDLRLQLTASRSSAVVGDVVSYSVSITNLGPATATAVTATGSLPACAVGTLAAGATATCTSTVTASTPGTLIQTMTATGGETDPQPANNTARVSTTVTPPAVIADVALAMTDSPDPVRRGGRLTYTMTIRNLGPSSAGGVAVRDILPSTATLLSKTTTKGTCSGTTTVTCAIGTLLNGEAATVTLVVRATTVGTLTNRADVVAMVTDANAANNTATATTVVKR